MKKSLNKRITAYFLIIVTLTAIISITWNYFSTRQSILDMEKAQAEGCAKTVSSLFKHFDDVLEEGKGSERYNFLQKAIRNLCKGFNQEAIYIYKVDPQTKGHRLLMIVDGIEGSYIPRISEEGEFLLPEASLEAAEASLLSGDKKLQRVVWRSGNEKTIIWLTLCPEVSLDEPVFLSMEYNPVLENGHIQKDFFADILIPIAALGIAFLVLNLMIRKRVSTPIHLISDRMQRFAHNSSEKPEPLNIHCNDEIGEIASSFETMTEEITAYIGNIEKLTEERVQTNVQLDIARRIQNGLVPEKKTLNDKAFLISAMTRPAKAVGGDFYDCFRMEDGSVCIMMGDVSGKGIIGAIFMTMIKTSIREKLSLGLSPAETLNRTNEQLMVQNPEGLFVTVFVAILNPDTGELIYANAGHTPPVLLGCDVKLLEPETGIPLGLFDDADIVDEKMNLKPGQGILLYTDGLTDALNSQRVLFGTKRLLETLKGIDPGQDPAENVLSEITGAVSNYCEGVEPFDDTAILVLFRTNVNAEDDEQSIPVSLSSFAIIKEAVFAKAGNTPETRLALLACDETLSNIVRYSGATELSFKCEHEENTLSVIFSDNGIAFDPTAALAQEKEFEELDSGGMGLNLIRQTASSARYERLDEKNIFCLNFGC